MAAQPLSEEIVKETYEAVAKYGSVQGAGDALGVRRTTFQNRWAEAKRWAVKQGLPIPRIGMSPTMRESILPQTNVDSTRLPQSADEAVAFALARGQMPNLPATASPRVMALAAGFDEIALPDRYAPLITGNRAGEALLLAALTLSGDGADLDDLSDALRVLRYLGLEDSARRAALQLYLLPDRNG